MRYRVTVRGDGVELRGYIDSAKWNIEGTADDFSDAMKPFGLVMVSPADDDYDPFKEERDRELHHFETEQMLERQAEIVASAIELIAGSGPFRDTDGYMSVKIGDDRRLREAVTAYTKVQ